MTGRPRVRAALTPRDQVTVQPVPRAEVEVFAGQFGPAGPSNTLTVESTTTGPPGSQADVIIGGQSPNQTIAFTIPAGVQGPTGPPGVGIPPPGLPVLATNLVTRPIPSSTNPWTLGGTGTNAPVIYQTGDPEVGDYVTFTVTAAPRSIQTAGNLPIGIVVTASAFYRNNGPEPLTVRMIFGGFTGAGFVVPADGQWHRFSNTATTTAVGPLQVVQFYQVSPTPTGTIDLARANVTPGPALLDYFDGDLPGGRWTGAAGNSTSELLGPRIGDIQGIVAARTPLELTGTGMPEGVVAAPVGSHYTDTAATNGAIRWIKQTGSGNTGWRVLWGDTGWVDISSMLTNGWTATQFRVKRRHTGIQLHITGLSASAATADNVTTAFNPGWHQARAVAIAGPQFSQPIWLGSWTRFIPPNVDNTTIRINRTDLPTTPTAATAQIYWQTDDPWPTTLP